MELSRRQFLAATIAASGIVSSRSYAQESSKPNFVFILADDLGWTDLACYGSSFYDTPNLDRLAASGMRFTNAYAACPVCSPTRASIMTGKYPARMATTDWFGAPQPGNVERHRTKNEPLLPAPYNEQMALSETTLAEAFHEAGYSTYFAGKWHLGGEGFFPTDQGFDINKGGHHRGSPPGGYFAPYKNPVLENGPDGEHLPARLAGETASFIEDHADKPFLAYLSFYSVHTPLQAREDLIAKYEARAKELPADRVVWGEEGERKERLIQDHAVYAGMVEAMDEAVGRVMTSLEDAGVANNTYIFFMSDNGGLSTSEGHPTSNVPLRAGKGWLYEGGIREPMMVSGPGIDAGTTCDVPVTSTDFYPTMLDLAKLDRRPEQHVDGLSMLPLLKGGEGDNGRAIYWHYPHYGNQGGSPGAAIRLGDWKLIEFFEDGTQELYNLANDIGETKNLRNEHKEKGDELAKMLHAWQKVVAARFPTPNPNAE